MALIASKRQAKKYPPILFWASFQNASGEVARRIEKFSDGRDALELYDWIVDTEKLEALSSRDFHMVNCGVVINNIKK